MTQTQTQTQAAWNLKGTVVQACNCDFGCPCSFNAPPTYGHCEGGYAWQVDEGRVGDTDLAGLSFAFYAAWPGAVHQGNGEAIFLIDGRANEAQRQAIRTLLSGTVGGPWAIFSATFSKVHDPQYVPFEFSPQEHHTTLRAGDTLRLELEPMKNAKTGADVHPGVVLPEGLVFKQASLTASKVFTVDDGVSYDHSGKYAAFAPFDYEVP